MRTFQIDILKIISFLDGYGIDVNDIKKVKERLEIFNDTQGKGTKLLITTMGD